MIIKKDKFNGKDILMITDGNKNHTMSTTAMQLFLQSDEKEIKVNDR